MKENSLYLYIKNISESIASTINEDNFIISYRCLNKLGQFKAQKDSNQFPFSNNIVYKISCKDCDASYVGQIKRQLRDEKNTLTA